MYITEYNCKPIYTCPSAAPSLSTLHSIPFLCIYYIYAYNRVQFHSSLHFILKLQRRVGTKLKEKTIRSRKVNIFLFNYVCSLVNSCKNLVFACYILKVECQKIEKPKQQRKDKCDLALDEELELRELQARPNPLTCYAHFLLNYVLFHPKLVNGNRMPKIKKQSNRMQLYSVIYNRCMLNIFGSLQPRQVRVTRLYRAKYFKN